MTTMTMPKPHGDRGMEGMVAKWYAANTAEVMNEYQDLAQADCKSTAAGQQRARGGARARATSVSNWPGWDRTRSPASISAGPL